MKRLTIQGGPPAFPHGSPNWPPFDPAIQDALEIAIRDGSWGKYHGPHTQRLQKRLTEIHALEYVTLCCSGTISVELALRGVGVNAGDEVVLSGYDFPGNFRAVEAVGARPVLIDIDPRTCALDARLLRDAFGPNTRAVIVSHLHGGTAAASSILQFAHQQGVQVIEDACQVPGAIVQDQIAGSWGDVAVLSFGGSKLLTAGRGGAILTRDADIHQRIKVYSDRGNQAFPLSEIQAAVLLPQLEELNEKNKLRRENVVRLLSRLEEFDGLVPIQTTLQQDEPVYYKLAWTIRNPKDVSERRSQLLQAFQAEGLEMGAGFRGFAKRSRNRCRHASRLDHSKMAAEATVLLHHPILLEPTNVVDLVAEVIASVLQVILVDR